MAARGPLERLRRMCRALPETSEKIAWGAPTFRVNDRMFAMYVDDHHGDGRVALWCKAPPGAQEILVGAAPKRFFVPPYVGHKGWVGIRLDTDVDWEEVAAHLEESYRMTAPRRRTVSLEGKGRRTGTKRAGATRTTSDERIPRPSRSDR